MKYCECGQERLKHIPSKSRNLPSTVYYFHNRVSCKGYVPDRVADEYCVNCKRDVHISYREFVLTHLQGKCKSKKTR